MFVAIVQQGMVLDQRAVACGEDRDALQKQAEAEAAKLQPQGMAEGYVAVVLKVEEDA